MTIEQKRKTLKRITVIQSDIDVLQGVIRDLATNPYVSATLSSGGGSKSYTKRNISEIEEVLEELRKEMKGLRQLLAGDGDIEQIGWRRIYPVYI